MIELKGVSKTLSGEKIFENVSLRVGNGECAAIICEREEQKILMTSILSCAAGVSDGAVVIDGYDAAKHRMKAVRQIGVVPAEGALYENMTLGEFLFFVAEAKEIPFERINARVQDALSLCALEAYRDKLIGALSHSVRRRALLAQAVIGDASALIICESGTELDAQSKKIFSNAVITALSRGASVVILCDEGSFAAELAGTVYKINGTVICSPEASEKESGEE